MRHKYFLCQMWNTKLFLGRSLPWLVGMKLAPLRTIKDTKESKSVRCNGKRCQVCQYIEETCEFEDSDGNKDDIQKRVINCNTDCTVYKFHCSSCSKQYTGSNITDFCYWFNNYKCAFRKISKIQLTPQMLIKYTFISTLNYLNTMVWMTGE